MFSMKVNMSQIKTIFQSYQMTDYSKGEVFFKNLVESYFHHHLRQTFFFTKFFDFFLCFYFFNPFEFCRYVAILREEKDNLKITTRKASPTTINFQSLDIFDLKNVSPS